MLINLFPPKQSLKNVVINTLLESPPQQGVAVQQLRQQIKKKHNTTATYQGINKILGTLRDEMIVVKDDHHWRVNEKWISTVSLHLNRFTSVDVIPTFLPDMKSISFSTMGHAFEFIRENIQSGSLRNNGEHFFITHVKNMAFFMLDRKERNFLKKFAAQNECHILIENNNYLNRLCAKYLRSIGCCVYLGIARSTPHTTTIYGNTLYRTFCEYDLISYMNYKYKQIKSMASSDAFKLFENLKDDQRFPIKFTFETDLEIITQTREFLLNLTKKRR